MTCRTKCKFIWEFSHQTGIGALWIKKQEISFISSYSNVSSRHKANHTSCGAQRNPALSLSFCCHAFYSTNTADYAHSSSGSCGFSRGSSSRRVVKIWGTELRCYYIQGLYCQVHFLRRQEEWRGEGYSTLYHSSFQMQLLYRIDPTLLSAVSCTPTTAFYTPLYLVSLLHKNSASI